jgi:hypothetical protein
MGEYLAVDLALDLRVGEARGRRTAVGFVLGRVAFVSNAAPPKVTSPLMCVPLEFAYSSATEKASVVRAESACRSSAYWTMGAV